MGKLFIDLPHRYANHTITVRTVITKKIGLQYMSLKIQTSYLSSTRKVLALLLVAADLFLIYTTILMGGKKVADL